MDLGLAGRQALVLGARRGLGGAVAKSLAMEGAVVLAAVRGEAAPDWVQTLPPDVASRVHVVHGDLANRAEVEGLADQAAAIGPTDILINNGGGPPPGGVLGATTDQWIAQFQTMAAHLFHLTGLILPGMIERGFGRIITIASSGVEQPIPNLGSPQGLCAKPRNGAQKANAPLPYLATGRSSCSASHIS